MTAHALPSVQIEIEVPFADVDSQRIVWHGNYLRYFELARVQLFAKCDLFSIIEEGLANFVVSESYCKHYHPLRFRDRCTINVSFVDIDHRLHLKFLITKSDGTKIAKGHTHVVTLNSEGKLQLVTPTIVTERIYAAGLECAPSDRDTVSASDPTTTATATEATTAVSRRQFVVATLALLSLAIPTNASAASPIPERLSALLAQHRKSNGFFAKFVEEKHIALLKIPLKNEGYLAYLRPDHFARVVETPSKSKIVAQGKTLAFREGTGPKVELSLENSPELRAIVDGIIFLLSGEVEKIEQYYDVRVTECAERCRVELIAKDEKMRALVRKFVVTLSSSRLESFEVHERSGDYSVTKLVSLDLNRAFSDAEKKSIFSI